MEFDKAAIRTDIQEIILDAAGVLVMLEKTDSPRTVGALLRQIRNKIGTAIAKLEG